MKERASLIVPAPAKLNLFLHVTGRRADGYHTLESVTVLLDFGDVLEVCVRDDPRIELTRPIPGVAIEDDLAHRAARLLQDHAGVRLGATIALDKRIPMGAGMGGGSSDAASVLLALNRLWNVGLTRGELMRLGLRLGADVPFFIFGANAHVTGIGETLREVSVPRLHFLIDVPSAASATRDVFAAEGLKRDTPPSGAKVFDPGFGGNDLQPVAIAQQPAIEASLRALDALASGGSKRPASHPARMTGSGSAVFLIVKRAVERADDRGAPIDGPQRLRARTIPCHPLRDFAAK